MHVRHYYIPLCKQTTYRNGAYVLSFFLKRELLNATPSSYSLAGNYFATRAVSLKPRNRHIWYPESISDIKGVNHVLSFQPVAHLCQIGGPKQGRIPLRGAPRRAKSRRINRARTGIAGQRVRSLPHC